MRSWDNVHIKQYNTQNKRTQYNITQLNTVKDNTQIILKATDKRKHKVKMTKYIPDIQQTLPQQPKKMFPRHLDFTSPFLNNVVHAPNDK